MRNNYIKIYLKARKQFQIAKIIFIAYINAHLTFIESALVKKCLRRKYIYFYILEILAKSEFFQKIQKCIKESKL